MSGLSEVTLSQIRNMKHAIGFEGRKVKRHKYVAYRNYYTTNDYHEGWDDLVERGYAAKRKFEHGVGDNPQVYFVTRAGMDVLEGILECKIVEDRE